MKDNNKQLVPWNIDEKHFLSEVVTDYAEMICGDNGVTSGMRAKWHIISGYIAYSNLEDSIMVTFEYRIGLNVVRIKSSCNQIAKMVAQNYKNWIEDDGEYKCILQESKKMNDKYIVKCNLMAYAD